MKISQKIQASSSIEELNICLGELNIAKLRKAQEKFRVRDERGDFITGAKVPRAASLIASNRSLPAQEAYEKSESESDVLDSQEGNKAFGKYKAQTPYGPIWIRLEGQDISNAERMIYYDSDCNKTMRYTEIATNLDNALNKYKSENSSLSNKEISKKFVDPMINYIGQGITFSQKLRGQDLLNKLKIPTKPTYLSILAPIQKQAAAVLCEVLLFSESHTMRNPTGGKFERESLKKVQRLIEKGENQPFVDFIKVYSNKDGLYTPAHDNSNNRLTGGRLQAKFTIQDGKIDSAWLKPRYTGFRNKIYQNIVQTITDHINQLQVLKKGVYLTLPYSTFQDKVIRVIEFWRPILYVAVTDINDVFINGKSTLATQIKGELDKEILKEKQKLTADQMKDNKFLPKNRRHKPGPPTQTQEAKNMQQQIGKNEFFQKWTNIKTELLKIPSYNTAITTLESSPKVKVEDMPKTLQKDLQKLIYKKDMKELFD